MNGVMHFSVLDGWWVEGYRQGAGWALPKERTYENQQYQDEMDAATIYNLLETEIVPLFYKRNAMGIPEGWVQHIKSTVAFVAGNFTTNRMMSDYEKQYYQPLNKRYHDMIAEDYALARELAFWKKRVEREWESVEVISYVHPNESNEVLSLGTEHESEVQLYLGALSAEDVGVEMVITTRDNDDRIVIDEIIPFQLERFANSEATFTCKLIPQTAGAYYIAARVYAKNDKLPHRQDFALVKWL